ncbi:MAG: EAL domain-containing protein [Candidatus Competibacteraceae bacterium]|nr:EAL domain-containing protein [Candidatus Competibacteraceae bacterium]
MHTIHQSDSQAAIGWYLEGFANEGKIWVIQLKPLPFVIGRHEGCHLRLAFTEVSRRHAEIFERDSQLWLRDFGSVNGTFLNRQRVNGEHELHSGDILHFGSQEFRITYKSAVLQTSRPPPGDATMDIPVMDLPQGFVNCEAEFDQMLRQRAVVPHYQPIVRMTDHSVVGYELLGRGGFDGLPSGAWPLLQIARSLGKEVELSELFRRVGVQKAVALGNRYFVFFNTLPTEMNIRFLQRSLRELRESAPDLPLAMEIHESAITNLDTMRSLRELLDDLDMKLVYDDFGAGQARLVELIEIPPDCLKFDIALIRNIHNQSPQAQQFLQTLVRMARDLGIQTLAEGTELAEEVEVCGRLGFDLAQGFYFGRPAPHFQNTP